ncbi:MAG: hypothetical protein A3J52_01400 [Omnitrophica bacterium RIFCSPHIGHO2_02_FULL_49_9]|nr:MAG: hypothetical protein A3J52_01400 [Omnitrophica bacterium RIFCSPHIGHO2_02_FULL_49_9]OGW89749.1 MAG: hypothetical protein A3A73_04670 [Omnitrophica bacterium RIFCSPLOWO2_01_FULL_50_24]
MKTIKQISIIGGFLIATSLLSSSLLYAGATVSGKVAFEGAAPTPAPINFGAERQCALMHKDKMPVNEDLIVNPNQTVKYALVYVKDGFTGDVSAPAAPVEVDQNGCMFTPHVAAAMAGQKVVFKNGDALLHNIRTESKLNKMFNIAQPIQGMSTQKVFQEPELGIRLRCDVHFWMSAYLHVLKNQFFSVTGDDGTFTIKDVPAGTYTLEVWHEKLGTQTQTITVADGETKTVDFTLKKQ